MGRNNSEMNKVPKVAKTGEFVLILWKKFDRNNKLSWSIQPVSTVKNLLQLQNPQICDQIESRLTNKPFKDCKSHMGYVVSRGTKSALEKNPDQTVEDFHKLLTDVNNSQASTSEDNDEEEDDDAKNQTDEEDQSKPDDSSSEHSNAKSSTAANKKDQQSATSNSNRKHTAEKDCSYQLSDAPRASADLDDSSSEHSKAKSSSSANKKDHRIETSTSISRKRTAEKDCSYQLSAGAKKQYQVDEIDQAKTIASLTSILAKKEEEIGKLRDENQRLKEKNLFLQDGLPQVISKLAKSNKSEQAPERWEKEEVQNALSKLELSPGKVKQLREKNKSSLLARSCLKFCFDEDVIARSVVVGGNQQKDAEAPKLDSDVLDNICDLVMARFPGAERKAIMSTFTLTTRDVKNKAKDK